MTETPSQIEWHLARDGHQYGPLSESEMRTFVELGHLRPTDLIWRVGFPEWRAAPEVFVIHPPAVQQVPDVAQPASYDQAPPAAAEAPAVEPGTQAQIYPVEQIIAAGQLAKAAAAADALAATTPAPVAEPVAAAPSFTPQELTTPAELQYSTQSRDPVGGRAAGGGYRAGTQPEPGPPTPQPRPATRQGNGPRRNTERAFDPRRGDSAGAPAKVTPEANLDFGLEGDEDNRPEGRRRIRFGLVAGLVFLLAVGGGGTVAFMKRDQLLAMLPFGGAGTGTASPQSAAPAIALSGGSAETVDDAFQRLPIWRHIKSEFPEWYAERVQEAVKLASENRSETAIAKHLAEAVVALRRKHAEQALTASPERLKFVATAFLDNLQALAKQNVDTCYGFISQGETYPAVLEMLQKQTGNEALQKQVIAVFEAISDGRKTPQSYLPPRKADYDALATELTARGWSEADLRTFSDPRALGKASPQQVCRMVQDWFAAQIAIKDPASQLRLLVESLRPVVAG